jgi:hypothetical protein
MSLKVPLKTELYEKKKSNYNRVVVYSHYLKSRVEGFVGFALTRTLMLEWLMQPIETSKG